MIDPSTLNLEALPSVPLAQRDQLPATPSIYFAIDSTGVIQYIGRSVNLRQRWVSHHRHRDLCRIGGVQIAYLECPSNLLDEIELALIQWFEPPLNGMAVARPNKPSNIRWCLRQVMADRRVSNTALAKAIKLTPQAIGIMKNRDDMPRIDGKVLGALCAALNCQPPDLIKYEADQ